MKRKLFLLICATLLASAFFAGCAAKDAKDLDLTADDLMGVIGSGYNELKRSIGTLEDEIDEMRGSKYSYKRTVFGGDANISVVMDDTGDKVERITVYTDKENIGRWRDELGLKYGVGVNDRWTVGKNRVSIIDSGKTAIISIERAA